MKTTLAPKTDGELVQRVRAGDREAFGELVDRYRDMVYGLGYHLTGEFEAASDLAQETFIQAYTRLGQLRDPAKFAGWLRRIAVNAYRTCGRRPQVATVSLTDQLRPAQRHPRRSDMHAAVIEALGRLRDTERLALTLHYVDGYSQAEIAGFLGVRAETVKTRLARARSRIRKEIMTMMAGTFENKRLPEDFTRDTVAAALRRGHAALENRDPDAALAAFGQAAELQPQSPDARVGLGAAWMLKHELLADPEALAKAQIEYQDALAQDPHCEEALLALAYMDQGDKRQAYERALEVLPESVELRYLLAWEVHAAGDTVRAVELMTAMLRDAIPGDVRVRLHNNLGCFFHDNLGDPTRGREHLRLAAETAEDTANAHLAFFHWRVYAWVALRDREWSEALGAAEHVVDRAPTDFEGRNLHLLMASALANLGNVDEALGHLQRAATPGPEPPDANRWPWSYRTPASAPDPLDWARVNSKVYFAPLIGDRRFEDLVSVRCDL